MAFRADKQLQSRIRLPGSTQHERARQWIVVDFAPQIDPACNMLKAAYLVLLLQYFIYILVSQSSQV